MNTRRTFLEKSLFLAAATAVPGCSSAGCRQPSKTLRTNDPKSALVVWYSQSGNTGRYGRLIASTLEAEGLEVTAGDYRDISLSSAGYDIIIAGSPVFYYELPGNMEAWLSKMPPLNGAAVAAFVSFGGPEGNQHNTLCSILDVLSEKGGCPVAMRAFMNMSTFPLPRWDGPGCLDHKHLPDGKTYAGVRGFALEVASASRKGRVLDYSSHVTIRQISTALPLAGIMKLFYRNHRIDKKLCTDCKTCVKKCPSRSIDPGTGTINRDTCLMCFGCVNNCPSGAVQMTYMGNELYGFPEFLKRNGIVIKEPDVFNPGKES